MKLSIPDNVHFSVLETSFSDYIKEKCVVMSDITKKRMEAVFKAKEIYSNEKSSYHKSSMFFHITLNGENIGYFICIVGMYKGTVWINEFFIEERYRNKGYGSLALDNIKAILKNKKYDKVCLSFVENNPAERLYIKKGFTHKICTDVMCEL